MKFSCLKQVLDAGDENRTVIDSKKYQVSLEFEGEDTKDRGNEGEDL